MRIQLTLSPAIGPVPFNYNYTLFKALHSWLGAQNPWHNALSLYSFGLLRGGRVTEGKLYFPQGARWSVSSWNRDLLAQLVERIAGRPEFAFGMHVQEARIQLPPQLPERSLLYLDSPVLIKAKRKGQPARHVTYRDPEAAELLTAALHRKMDAASCPPEWKSLHLSFDRAYKWPRTKLIDVKGLQHRASLCPLIAEGPAEAMAFLWSVGAGHNTGMGFGALK